MTNPDDKYTPNMEKLKADLGRAPPSMVTQSRPEDFAPKPKLAYASPNWEPELAQRMKALMRENSNDWSQLTWGEREALDKIASNMAGICAGRDYWDAIPEHVMLAEKSKQEP